MEIDPRQETRYPLAEQRECGLCIITFKDLAWKDHRAYLKDISPGGVGIESETLLDRGFVWFTEPVAGHRSGILLWNRLVGYNYRAGIQFVPLTHDQEHRIGASVETVRAHQPLRDPEAIVATILASMSGRGGAEG